MLFDEKDKALELWKFVVGFIFLIVLLEYYDDRIDVNVKVCYMTSYLLSSLFFVLIVSGDFIECLHFTRVSEQPQMLKTLLDFFARNAMKILILVLRKFPKWLLILNVLELRKYSYIFRIFSIFASFGLNLLGLLWNCSI